MDRAAFWKIIDQASNDSDDVQDVPPTVTEALAKLEPDEIISFKQNQYDLEGESCRWDLWAVAYIVNGGCSDDAFDYFRGWLMANGSQRWNAAMKKPESIGEWAEFEEVDCEDMLYVAVDAYKQSTGEEFPYDRVTSSRPEKPTGAEWEEEELEELYPQLWQKYLNG